MRGLVALVVGMGVLIVAGVAVIGITIAHRMGAAALAPAVTLDEPSGTRMVALGSDGGRLAVLLSGGGPDRVVVLAGGRVVGRISLKQ